MPSNSTAILANGTLIQIATGTGGAKTVTGLALGFPTIVTSAAHGLNNGDVVTFAALAGNTTLNGLTLSIKNVTTNTFAVDVNTTGGAAWTSGGTATPVTFSTIGNAKSFSHARRPERRSGYHQPAIAGQGIPFGILRRWRNVLRYRPRQRRRRASRRARRACNVGHRQAVQNRVPERQLRRRSPSRRPCAR
jgi:hypothetical protein